MRPTGILVWLLGGAGVVLLVAAVKGSTIAGVLSGHPTSSAPAAGASGAGSMGAGITTPIQQMIDKLPPSKSTPLTRTPLFDPVQLLNNGSKP